MSDVAYDPIGNFNAGYGRVSQALGDIARTRAGRQLASGDPRAASNTLYRSGDLEGGQALQQQSAAQAAEQRSRELASTLQITRALRNARNQGQDVAAALDGYRPLISQLGVDENAYNQLRGIIASDPSALDKIEQFAGEEQRRLQIENLGEGYAVAIDPSSGAEVARYERPRTPQRVVVGNDYVEVGPDGTVRPLYQGARDPEYVRLQNSNGTEDLVAVGGRPAGVLSGSGGSVDPVQVLQGIIPGVTFNSGLRTPEQNRSAGGSPNSYHLSGRAVDIPRQQGMTTQQLRQQLESQGVQVRELIDEGDHWHIAWGEGAAAPNFGRGERVPASNGVQVLATGQNNGLSRQEVAAQQREQRQDRRDATALRREFDGLAEVKTYREIDSAYQRMQSLARSGTATDDIALGFNFMKTLDPTSVVREGEYALVGRAQGLTGRALLALERLDSGQALTPELRIALVATAGREHSVRQQRYQSLAEQYRSYAQEDGFDPNRIVPLSSTGAGRPRTNAPGLPFNVSEAQQRTRQQLVQRGASSSAPVGSALNPRYMNPADPASSWQNARSGDYVVRPDGRVVRKP